MKTTKLFLSDEAGVVSIVVFLVILLIAAALFPTEWIKGAPHYYNYLNAILSEWLGGEMTRGNWFFIVAMLFWALVRWR